MDALIIIIVLGIIAILFAVCLNQDKPQNPTAPTPHYIYPNYSQTAYVPLDMPLKENTKIVYEALYLNRETPITARDISNITGLDVKQVNGIFTSALQRRGFGAREEVTVQGGKIKLLHLTPEGIRFWEGQK